VSRLRRSLLLPIQSRPHGRAYSLPALRAFANGFAIGSYIHDFLAFCKEVTLREMTETTAFIRKLIAER
jgi:hypothetical protein